MRLTIVIAVLMFSLANALAGTYGGGSGEADNPYLIYTPKQLNQIGSDPNDWDAHFRLMADPNMADLTGTQFNIIGTRDVPFTGHFDGNNHTVKSLSYTTTEARYRVAMFGHVGDDGQITNLGLTDANINASKSIHVGILAGFSEGPISNCYVKGSVTGYTSVGGLIGHNQGAVSNCYAETNSMGDTTTGGLVGFTWASTISNCNSSGTVMGRHGVGGLAGVASSGCSISNCYSTAATSATYGFVGGLVGSAGRKVTISESHADGRVTGDTIVGGLIGSISWTTISECRATGRVTGDTIIGGLVGKNYGGKISNSHATGDVVATESEIGGLVGHNYGGKISNSHATGTVVATGSEVGGLVGHNFGFISKCYATGSVSTSDDEAGGLVGCTVGDSIIDCYATGNVEGDDNIGGLVGYSRGETWHSTLSKCCATGDVSGDDNVGGLVGKTDSVDMFLADITNCYARGTVTGEYRFGGLAGSVDGPVSYCYATGTVVRKRTNSYPYGGLIGDILTWYTQWPLVSLFWDIESSGQSRGVGYGVIGKTTSQMQTKATYAAAGWDFVDESVNGRQDIWTIDEGKSYPRFWWQPLENTAPVADAGEDIEAYAWIDGFAVVEPNGFESFDVDGDELTYRWSWEIEGEVYEANEVMPLIALPVGEHLIELVVNDGIEDSEPNSVRVTVIAPIEAKMFFVPRVINSNSQGRFVMTMMYLPEGIDKGDIVDGSFVLYINGDDSNPITPTMHRIVAYRNRWRIFVTFNRADLTAALAADDSAVRVDVAGTLSDGGYIYGSDTVRIVTPRKRRLQGRSSSARSRRRPG